MSDDDETGEVSRRERRELQYKDHVHTRKAAVAIVAIVAITLLVFFERLDPSAALAAISGITFYILGNGVAAWKGEEVQPVIRSGVRYGRRADD